MSFDMHNNIIWHPNDIIWCQNHMRLIVGIISIYGIYIYYKRKRGKFNQRRFEFNIFYKYYAYFNNVYNILMYIIYDIHVAYT